MRKVKIFLTMLAIAGVLFATTTSCVDNTESESVSELRKAKAKELNASADYLTAKIAIDRELATAQAGLLAAQALAEGAQVGYLQALGQKEVALGDAEKLKAEAEKIKAQAKLAKARGDSLKLVAEAVKIDAEAAQIISAYTIKADSAAHILAVIKARTEKEIVELTNALEAAKALGKLAALKAELVYLKFADSLDFAEANYYVALVDTLTNTLDKIYVEDGNIAKYTIAIAEAKLALASYAADSASLVRSFLTTTKAKIQSDKVDLAYEQKNLARWEGIDDILSLERARVGLVEDTTETWDKWQAYIDTVDALILDTTATYNVLNSARTAKNTAVAAEKLAKDNLEKAQEKLNDYLLVSSTNYGSPWIVATDRWGEVVSYRGKNYNVNDFTLPNGPYPVSGSNRFGGLTFLSNGYINNFDPDDDKDIHVYVYVEKSYDGSSILQDTYVYWSFHRNEEFYDFESQYTSLPAVDYRIGTQKVVVAEAKKTLDDAAKYVSDTYDSVKQFSDDRLKTAAALKSAEEANIAARKVYDAARAKFDAIVTPTATDIQAVNAASKPYNWTIYNGVTGQWESATEEDKSTSAAVTKAQTAQTTADTKYGTWNGNLKSAIQSHITAFAAHENSKLVLKYLEEDVRPIFADGKLVTRDKLEIEVQKLQKIYNDLVNSESYTKALVDYDDALARHEGGTVIEEDELGNEITLDIPGSVNTLKVYNRSLRWTKRAHQRAVDNLSKFDIEFEFKVVNFGGDPDFIAWKTAKIEASTSKIAELTASIAANEDKLKDVENYTTYVTTNETEGLQVADSDKPVVVALVINYLKQEIITAENNLAKAQAEKAKLNVKADYYRTAIQRYVE
jgi:hypothetical protein